MQGGHSFLMELRFKPYVPLVPFLTVPSFLIVRPRTLHTCAWFFSNVDPCFLWCKSKAHMIPSVVSLRVLLRIPLFFQDSVDVWPVPCVIFWFVAGPPDFVFHASFRIRFPMTLSTSHSCSSVIISFSWFLGFLVGSSKEIWKTGWIFIRLGSWSS